MPRKNDSEKTTAVAKTQDNTPAQVRQASGRATVQALFESQSGQLSKALNGQISTERFIRAAMTAYSNGGQYFQRADPISLLAACIQAAQLGLSVDPVLGEAWLIPRKNSKRNCVWINFQLGYKGLLKLARRNTNFLAAHAEIVRVGDEFEYDLGSDPRVVHRKQLQATEPTDMLCTYAVVRYREGSAQVHVSPRFEILAARDRSDSYKSGRGPWIDHFESMAMIVPLRAILKLESVDGAVLEQLGREDAQERSSDVIEVGLEGEFVLPTEDLPPEQLGDPRDVDDLKHKFAVGKAQADG